jgi:hypothetical protein
MQGQVMMNGHGINRGIQIAGGQQGLAGRGKAQSPRRQAVIQRLDAEAVTRHEQLLPVHIPDGEGKHAMQVSGAIIAPLRIGLQNHLAVTVRKKAVAPGPQLLAQLGVVVDGAVEYQHQPERLVHHRLPGTFGKVDDREPPVAQRHRTRTVFATGIRSPARQPPCHCLQYLCSGLLPVETQFTTDATHS